MTFFNQALGVAGIATALMLAPALTHAQSFPNQPLKIVVPLAAEIGNPKVLSDNWYGLIAPAGSLEEFRGAHGDEKAKWAPIVRANNIKLD